MKFNFVIKIRAPHFKSVQQKCERGRKCADVGATGTAANSIPALAVLWPRSMVDQQLYLNERTRTWIGGKWKNSALTCCCMCAHVGVHIGTSGFRPIPTPALLPPFSCFPFPLRSFTSVLLGSTFFRRVENSFFAGLWKVFFSLSLSAGCHHPPAVGKRTSSRRRRELRGHPVFVLPSIHLPRVVSFSFLAMGLRCFLGRGKWEQILWFLNFYFVENILVL